MEAAEIPFRAWRLLTQSLEQAGLRARGPVPRCDGNAYGPRWIGPVPAVDPAPYLEAGHRIVAGRVPAFERSELNVGVPPVWNRDPRTGRTAPLSFGPALNYRDPTVAGDPKYLWEPSRHQHLVILAQCYALTGDPCWLKAVAGQVGSWLEQCPYPLGPNWTSALECGIRLLNWSVTWQLIGGAASPLFAPVEGRTLLGHWLASVYRHAQFIRQHRSLFSSANNHLVGELAGLYVAGVTWPCWSALRLWRESARRALIREAMRQNTADGVNREQATGYHVYTLDYLLVAGLAARAAGEPFPDTVWRRLRAMVRHLLAITDMRGNLPMFGDCDGGTVIRLSPAGTLPAPLRSAARLAHVAGGVSGAPVDDGVRWLPSGESATPEPPGDAFPQGGYYILGTARGSPDEVHVVADAGSLGLPPLYAHGHADALSFTLSVAGHPLLVDPGTYDYYSEPAWRNYFRSTAAHNTVQVDGADQSVMAGAFLWRSAARVRVLRWSSSGEADDLEAEHDGYARLPDPVIHRRSIRLVRAARRIEVQDRLVCRAWHEVAWHWHFAPACVAHLSGSALAVTREGVQVTLSWPKWLQADVYRGSDAPRLGWFSPAFGERVPAPTLVVRGEINGETTVATMVTIRSVAQQ